MHPLRGYDVRCAHDAALCAMMCAARVDVSQATV